MVLVDEYFCDLMKKILSRYDVIKNLEDSKEDFFTLDVELTKINGLLRVLLRKSEEFSDKNPEFSKLTKKIQNYFDNYYFSGELEKIKEIYSEDPLRIKHIRNSIINSLQNDNMIFRINKITKDLE
ncbi:MAG: hypothetical protein HOC53_03540 [Candidatus Nitrosopelagicus sp.]|jgi:uncharacterized membrane protein YgaE (UPF0421/DUF939 family)|nr:hypothetical protein [Candidatus Nitrosopelagicus sp.]MBT6646426.1 hypothetical protein [Nitrososphaerota archaeon]MBT4325965.1 hypothetical protein [Candidatus Nitrosopelagicus sp.]MBT4455006.1 hypothetical protein [Candidatus Nitrosopelagicus sp.]MBT5171629.1 hypothetical protein [Candidatus Nitrosopelagicus sp.]|tara:strand:- start:912 stop:1289 length:378 start_codon:yes stop_codon:yes gene_type:complete